MKKGKSFPPVKNTPQDEHFVLRSVLLECVLRVRQTTDSRITDSRLDSRPDYKRLGWYFLGKASHHKVPHSFHASKLFPICFMTEFRFMEERNKKGQQVHKLMRGMRGMDIHKEE